MPSAREVVRSSPAPVRMAVSANPIIRPGARQWDADACYKPFALLDDGQWLLWYNGRRGQVEQIGLAVHPGADLDF